MQTHPSAYELPSYAVHHIHTFLHPLSTCRNRCVNSFWARTLTLMDEGEEDRASNNNNKWLFELITINFGSFNSLFAFFSNYTSMSEEEITSLSPDDVIQLLCTSQPSINLIICCSLFNMHSFSIHLYNELTSKTPYILESINEWENESSKRNVMFSNPSFREIKWDDEEESKLYAEIKPSQSIFEVSLFESDDRLSFLSLLATHNLKLFDKILLDTHLIHSKNFHSLLIGVVGCFVTCELTQEHIDLLMSACEKNVSACHVLIHHIFQPFRTLLFAKWLVATCHSSIGKQIVEFMTTNGRFLSDRLRVMSLLMSKMDVFNFDLLQHPLHVGEGSSWMNFSRTENVRPGLMECSLENFKKKCQNPFVEEEDFVHLRELEQAFLSRVIFK